MQNLFEVTSYLNLESNSKIMIRQDDDVHIVLSLEHCDIVDDTITPPNFVEFKMDVYAIDLLITTLKRYKKEVV